MVAERQQTPRTGTTTPSAPPTARGGGPRRHRAGRRRRPGRPGEEGSTVARSSTQTWRPATVTAGRSTVSPCGARACTAASTVRAAWAGVDLEPAAGPVEGAVGQRRGDGVVGGGRGRVGQLALGEEQPGTVDGDGAEHHHHEHGRRHEHERRAPLIAQVAVPGSPERYGSTTSEWRARGREAGAGRAEERDASASAPGSAPRR